MHFNPPRFVLGGRTGIRIRTALLALAPLLAATTGDAVETSTAPQPFAAPTRLEERPPMWFTVGSQRFAVALEDNATAQAFVRLLPTTFEMSDLNGNEKHVTLPRPFPANATRPGTIRAGDVMLYGSDTLVVFYETFSSRYSYTRIGRVTDGLGLAQVLGPGSVRVTFAAAEPGQSPGK
jgi:hypothetical protein